MKSCRVLLVFLFAFSCSGLNAQFFAGGNIGLNIAGNKSEYENTTTHDASNFSLNFSPYAGIFLSDKVAVGLEMDLLMSGNKNGINNEIVHRSHTIGGSPFIRYYFWNLNKFSIFGQGNVGVEFSGSTTKSGGLTVDGPKEIRAYLNIYPGLSYDLTDNLSFQTSLNFLSLGYSYFVSRDGSFKDVTSSFNFGTGLSNILSIGSITIGAIYKF